MAISCLLVRQGDGGAGTRLTGETIDIGRGVGCAVHLPADGVDELHATIRRGADGSLWLQAQGEALLSVDGALEREAMLRPGSRIGIGPCTLAVGVADGADLSLELAATAHDGGGDAAPQFAAPIGKRALGAALAGVVLLAFVALPLLSRAWPALGWTTAALSPGVLSAGHLTLADRCPACHERAFAAVADGACVECHPRTGVHRKAVHPDGQTGAEPRCAECHAGHVGRAAATPQLAARCVGCHERQGAKAVARATDFAADHPGFAVTPRERPGLKFSHALHLAKEGVSSPDGDTVLECRNCHHADAGGAGFAPMRMEETCQQSRCHKLRLDEPLSGVVAHGGEAAVMERLRGLLAARIAEVPGEHARACGGTGSVRKALDCAQRLADDYAAATLFRSEGEGLQCGLCHEVAHDQARAAWKVASVRLGRDLQPTAAFPHARHAAVACGDCHDKAASKSSADVSLPRIAKCRECHGGKDGGARLLASSCESCHRFHRSARAAP